MTTAREPGYRRRAAAALLDVAGEWYAEAAEFEGDQCGALMAIILQQLEFLSDSKQHLLDVHELALALCKDRGGP